MGNLLNFFMLNKINFRNVLKNSLWLTLSQGLNGLANLVLAIYIARVYGPTEYGKFAYGLSFVMLFSTLFDFGLTTAATKEFALDSNKENHFQSVFMIKSLIGLIAVGLLIGLSFLITKDPKQQKIIIMLSLYQFSFQSLNLIYAVFRARQRMEFEAFIRFVQTTCIVLFSLLMIIWGHSILAIAYAYAIAVTVTLILSILAMSVIKQWSLFSRQFKMDFSACKHFLLIGWYLALAQGVGDIMINTDSFLLGYWGMLKGAGLYNAATKINAVILFPMSIASTALFPALIAALKKSKEEFLQYWKIWMRVTFFFATLMGFWVMSEAPAILSIIYTNQYSQASGVLKVLSVMTIMLYTSNLYYQMLLIFNQQRLMFYALCCGSVLNVILNLILIPLWGIEGSAFATVCSQLVNGVLYIVIAEKKTFINPLDKDIVTLFSIALIAGLLMLLSLNLLQIPFFISILLGPLFYLLSFLFIKEMLMHQKGLPILYKKISTLLIFKKER